MPFIPSRLMHAPLVLLLLFSVLPHCATPGMSRDVQKKDTPVTHPNIKMDVEDLDLGISDRREFRSGVAARAGGGDIQGEMHYKIYRLEKPPANPMRIRTCYLQHGLGVGQGIVSFKRLTFNTFVKTYFGLAAVRRLLANTCAEVIVAMQESNRTSILEMTLRTEKFLKEVVCAPRTTRLAFAADRGETCAYIGHSKGGAAAFNIARRCMQRSSSLGAEGCAKLGEIYSAGGVIQGSMTTFLAYGAYIRKSTNTAQMITNALGFGMDLVLDIYMDYVPGKTNPTWFDLNPGAPMEDGRALYVVNDIALRKTGWLRADFAASTTGYRFSGKKGEKLFGCGKGGLFNANYRACRTFGAGVGALHQDRFRVAFESGLRGMRSLLRDGKTKGSPAFLNGMSWNLYQRGDGMADMTLAISACRKGLNVREGRAVKDCKVFADLNHLALAGGGPEAIRHIIAQLRD